MCTFEFWSEGYEPVTFLPAARQHFGSLLVPPPGVLHGEEMGRHFGLLNAQEPQSLLGNAKLSPNTKIDVKSHIRDAEPILK